MIRREATLSLNILNTVRKFARISKFRCFHETKTQKEVGRFFYNLAEFIFQYFCDSRIIVNFAKFFLKSLFATLSYRYLNPNRFIQHALKLPSLSHTCVFHTINLYKPIQSSLFFLRLVLICREKAVTIGDFTVSRPTQILISNFAVGGVVTNPLIASLHSYLSLKNKNGFCHRRSRHSDPRFCRYISKIWEGRETMKSPIVWDFSEI